MGEFTPGMSVRELMDELNLLSPDLQVVALYDCRCAEGNVRSVEIGPGPDSRVSVILIVE